MRNDVITVITVNRVISPLKPLNVPSETAPYPRHASPRKGTQRSETRAARHAPFSRACGQVTRRGPLLTRYAFSRTPPRPSPLRLAVRGMHGVSLHAPYTPLSGSSAVELIATRRGPRRTDETAPFRHVSGLWPHRAASRTNPSLSVRALE